MAFMFRAALMVATAPEPQVEELDPFAESRAKGEELRTLYG